MLDLVANRVPLPIQRAIRFREGRLILLHEIDHPDGYVRAWSGVGSLSYATYSWFGFGDLVSIEGLGGSRKTEVRVVTATLAGVTPEQLSFVTKKVRGRLARLSLAALRTDQRAVNGDTFVLCQGLCDTQDHQIEQGRQAKIVITVNQPVFIMDRAPNLAWTPDWLKAEYGDDVVGLDDLPGVASRNESWTPS